MRTELVHAFLASSAELLADGRFCVLGGGIDAIGVPAFPVVLPVLAVVARFRVPPEQSGRVHQITVNAVGPEGASIGSSGPVGLNPYDQIGPRIGPLEYGIITNIVVNLYNLKVESMGVCRFIFLDDGEPFGELAFPIANALDMQGG